MTFETWLLKQKNREDIVGDLSRDFMAAMRCGDKKCNKDTLSRWNATEGAFTALEVAESEYYIDSLVTDFVTAPIVLKGAQNE